MLWHCLSMVIFSISFFPKAGLLLNWNLAYIHLYFYIDAGEYQFAFQYDKFALPEKWLLNFEHSKDCTIIQTFFCSFECIGLTLGRYLYFYESEYQFIFWYDWFGFARIMTLELSKFQDWQFSRLFFCSLSRC